MAASTPPEFHEQVQIDATVGQHNFETGFANASLNPTVLGEFGSRIAIEASTALAQKRGLEAGMDPHGTLLPPITSADKAYQDAYVAQANNTLSMQASKMMLDGEMELSKAYKLTPDSIASYSKNMAEGINKIINTAPMQAQPGLQAQFGSSLMRTTAQYNQKMIAQQKEQAIENANINTANQLASLFDAGRAGQFGAAKSILKASLQTNKQMLDSGMISPKEADANEKSARISYYSGVYSAEALQESKTKTVDEYLKDLVDRKPPDGIHAEEWESITKNVINEVARREAFNSRNQTALVSEANRLVAEGSITSGHIAQFEKQMDKPQFNNLMTQLAYQQRAKQKDTSAVDGLTANWNNVDAMSVANDKTKNSTLANVANAIQENANNKGRSIDQFQASTEAMASAGGPVSDFTKTMNGRFESGNPAMMNQAIQSYRYLLKTNPKVLAGVNKSAEAMMTVYENQIENGNDPVVAAARAREVLQAKTPEQQEINTKLIADWTNNTISTPSKRMSWSKQFADVGNGVPINNLSSFSEHAANIFKENMNYVNGDVAAATEMTKKGLARSWDTTHVNGAPEYTFMPVEKAMNLDAGAVPLIRNDIYMQVKNQIAPMEELWNIGEKSGDQRMPFHYRLPERPGYDDYAAAKTYMYKHPTFLSPKEGEKLTKARETINAFENQELSIEKVYSSGRIEKFKLAVNANPGVQMDPAGNLSAYNISIRQDNGASFPMNGHFSGDRDTPIYSPNANHIKQRYAEVVGLNPTHKSVAQEIAHFQALQKEKNKAINPADQGVNRLGRTFN